MQHCATGSYNFAFDVCEELVKGTDTRIEAHILQLRAAFLFPYNC